MATATMAASTAALLSHVSTVQTCKADARSSMPLRKTVALSSGQQVCAGSFGDGCLEVLVFCDCGSSELDGEFLS